MIAKSSPGPYLIVFEGIDGSGKTTQSRRLADHLIDKGSPVRCFREPSDSPWGKRIRKMAREPGSLSPEAELDLFVRDRRWNIRHHICPALKEGQNVIQDRYFYSTAAYQGARGFDYRRILRDHRQFAPLPDLVLYIDVPVRTGLGRIARHRSRREELFEQEHFLERVREIYRKLEDPALVTIDGIPGEAQVFAGVLEAVARALPTLVESR